MGRTLFWYIFKDLLKIFFMASGALAGIMSFGGLLRPLTQQGLDASQVGKMLTYFTFPMMAYSLPVAALFAATMVYGRLGADNELTACRAGGISHLGVAMPAFVLGLVVAILSLLMLCFVVPIYTLKVEKVVYSNLAKLIANRIDRTHEIKFGDFNVFAQRAYLPEADPRKSGRQTVLLEGVSIATYTRAVRPDAAAADASDDTTDEGTDGAPKKKKAKAPTARPADKPERIKVPREFLLASSATVEIHDLPNDRVEMLIGLSGGTKFPREVKGQQVGVLETQFGPMPIASPIKEDTKFMKVQELRHLYTHPEDSKRINTLLDQYVSRDQVYAYRDRVADALNPSPAHPGVRRMAFEDPDGRVTITLADNAPAALAQGATWLDEVGVHGTDPATVVFQREGKEATLQTAREMVMKFRPDAEKPLMHVTVELIGRAPLGGGKPLSESYTDLVTVPMPPDLARFEQRTVGYYLGEKPVAAGQRSQLTRELMVLYNAIWAESNGRASFAVSCFILVLVGCALGMMFRSGNFLTAFAVSFIPALLCITLIVSGQQTCHAVPWQLDRPNPLGLGVTLIWAGNGVNLLLAVGLLWKLQRQ